MASGMTKTALVRNMAEKLEIINKQAAAFLQHLADTAIKETKKNGVFVIPGLGRLVKAERKARMGRNPQTGEPIKIKAKAVIKYRVAKAEKYSFTSKKGYFESRKMRRPASCRPFRLCVVVIPSRCFCGWESLQSPVLAHHRFRQPGINTYSWPLKYHGSIGIPFSANVRGGGHYAPFGMAKKANGSSVHPKLRNHRAY